MEPVKRKKNFGENNVSAAKIGKPEMSTHLINLGLERENRMALFKIFNILAKSDFWHDFGSSFMQDLLNTASLTSSLSFAQRAKSILKIRQSLSENQTVQEYFMDSLDQILPGKEANRNTFRTEKKLLREIGINFEIIEGQLKKWNEDKKSLKELPVIDDIKPIYGSYSRDYSIRAVPVKGYNENIYLPSVFREQTKVHNFILMIDASHLSLTELGKRKLTSGELLDAIEGFDEKAVYNFYIVESNENESDPATKITEVEVDENLQDIINIYFLRDEGNVSLYPIFLGSEEDQGQNENLYSRVGIQSTRSDKKTITATLTGEVNTIIEDLGEISKIDKAAQKAVDLLIEKNGEVTPECLSYFLLKRAGDWCQALCLLDRTRVYSLYKQKKVTKTTEKILKRKIKYVTKSLIQPVFERKVTLQELIDEHKQQIVVALVTLDRVLLAFALLLGLNVFFTTKYLNLNPDKKGTSSIHWSLFFQNKLSAKVSEEEKGLIKKSGLQLQASNFHNIFTALHKIQSYYKPIFERFQILEKEILGAESLDTYLTKLHFYTYLQMSLITPSELNEIEGKVKEYIDKIIARNSNPPTTDSEFLQMRDELMNFNIIYDKLTSISNQNESVLTVKTYPEEEHHREILIAIIERLQNTKGSSDFRKHISYNNFLEETIKTLLDKFTVILGKGLLKLENIQAFQHKKEYELQFVDPSAKEEPIRAQSLILKYIREAVVTGFPKTMSGGFQYTTGQSLDIFKKLIIYSFFGLRNRRILALNLYKYNQLTSEYSDEPSNIDILVGLKQAYITDRDGNYFSILDNYLVTDAEEIYFFDIENENKKIEEANKNEIGKLVGELEKEGAKSELYLLMFRYIIMRQRLYLCDKYYQEYRELLGEYEEELRLLLEENPEQIERIYSQDNLFISLELQKRIRQLATNLLDLQNEIKTEGLFSLQTSIGAPITFYNYFRTIYYRISDIRLNIFSYSKRYYTPTTEIQFQDFEAAIILAKLSIPKSEKESILKIFNAESETDREIMNQLEKKSSETSKKNVEQEKRIKDKVSKNIVPKSGVPLGEFSHIVDNTIVDLDSEFQSIDSKIGILLKVAAESLKGGRRKTKRNKKRSSKRKTRKQ